MIITDFAEISQPETLKLSDFNLKKVEALRSDLDALERVTSSNRIHRIWLNRRNNRSSMASEFSVVREDLENEYESECWDVFCEHMNLPKKILDEMKDEPMSLAARSPRIQLKEVRRIADVLGFMVLPWEYLQKSTYENVEHRTNRAIRGFVHNLQSKMNVYVLAPISCYSVWQHIQAKEDKDIYTSMEYEQAFMALSMAIPAFRGMQVQIDSLGDRLSDVEKNQSHIRKEIENLQKRVDILEKRAEAQMREQALAAAKEKESKLIREIDSVIAEDPLLFAFSKEGQITDNIEAIVGPCWGEDFDDIVCEVLGFTKQGNQRKNVHDHCIRWYDFPSGRN